MYGEASSSSSNTLLSSVSVPELFSHHGKNACELQEKKLREFLANPAAVNFNIDAHKETLVDCMNDPEGGFLHKLCCLFFLNSKNLEKMAELDRSLMNSHANIKNYPYGSAILKLLKPELCKEKVEQPIETLTLSVNELMAMLDHNRNKKRRAACLAITKLLPTLTPEERRSVFDKLSDKAKSDDDLDVCLDCCHLLISLGRLMKDKDNQPVEVAFESVNDAMDHMNDLDEITCDPDQAWVIDQVACKLISTLAHDLEDPARRDKNQQALNRFLDAPEWQVRQAALEGLMKIGNPQNIHPPRNATTEFLTYSLYCETVRPKAERVIDNKI